MKDAKRWESDSKIIQTKSSLISAYENSEYLSFEPLTVVEAEGGKTLLKTKFFSNEMDTLRVHIIANEYISEVNMTNKQHRETEKLNPSMKKSYK